MTFPVFAVGDHADEVEQLGFCKVLEVVRIDPLTGFGVYTVRQFSHPHRIETTDSHHLSKLQGLRHDPRAHRMGRNKLAIRW